jgi:hypothetical protein
MSVEQIKLDPCTFCEGPPKPIVTDSIRGGCFDESNIPDEGIIADGYVFCHECGASGPAAERVVFDNEDCNQLVREAVDLWQNRDARNRSLYDLGDKDGLNLFPRSSS